MSDLDAFLEGIVADPANTLRWLVMADYLEENGQPERAELVRVHRELLRTCTATRETKARKQLHARMMELMRAGVGPCLPQRTITLPGGVEMRFSFIPPGTFLMGSPKLEVDKPWSREVRHHVTLTKGYWVAQSPVTQQQWATLSTTNPSHFKGEQLPVEQVSWDGADEYCQRFQRETGFVVRLPTEAEWERACRAGTTTPFHWGDDLNGTQANCHGVWAYKQGKRCTDWDGLILRKTTPVGSYVTQSSHPWLLVDMSGNVFEWSSDWWSWSGNWGGTQVDPTGPSPTEERVQRGGSWNGDASGCRSGSRKYADQPNATASWCGFRLAADLSALA